MSSLPTCWYCPDCGLIDAYDMTGDHEDAEGWCEGVMVTIPAIPPGTTPEQILGRLVGEVDPDPRVVAITNATCFYCPRCHTLQPSRDIVHVTDGRPCRGTGLPVVSTPEQIARVIGYYPDGAES